MDHLQSARLFEACAQHQVPQALGASLVTRTDGLALLLSPPSASAEMTLAFSM